MKKMFASDEEMDMEAANDVTNTSFTAYWDYGASQTSEVIMARIPTANPWAESLKKASVWFSGGTKISIGICKKMEYWRSCARFPV